MHLMGKILIAATGFVALSGSALAADLYVPPTAAPMSAPAAAASGWDGAYIGATVGYGWGSVDVDDGDSSDDISGGLLGVQLGYNFHVSDTVILGIQGDLGWLNESHDYGEGYNYHLNYGGAVVGRLGIDAGQFMPYVEAGVAFANATYDDPSFSGSDNSASHTGWTVGAGVEFMLTSSLSTNIEVRYTDYGDVKYPCGCSFHPTDTQVRLGLNYHF